MLKVCVVALGSAKKLIYTHTPPPWQTKCDGNKNNDQLTVLFGFSALVRKNTFGNVTEAKIIQLFFFCSYTLDCVVHILPKHIIIRCVCIASSPLYTISRCNLVCVHFRLIVIRFVMVYVRKGVKNARQLFMEKPEWKILIIAWGAVYIREW